MTASNQDLDKSSNDQQINKWVDDLNNPEGEVRKQAIEALGKARVTSAIDLIVKSLDENDHSIRAKAAQALGRIGDSRAVEPLIKKLKDEDKVVRGYSAWSLGLLKDKKAIKPLIEAYENDDLNEWWEIERMVKQGPGVFYVEKQQVNFHWSIVAALREIGDKSAVDILIQALKDDTAIVREQAVKALEKINDSRAAVSLLEAMEENVGVVHEVAKNALIRLGANAVEPIVDRLKESSNPANYRFSLVSLLVEVGQEVVVPLTESLGDEDHMVRNYVASALGDLGDYQAVEPLIQALKDEEYASVRVTIVGALGKIGDQRAIEALTQACKDKKMIVRMTAKGVLKAIDSGYST